MIARFLAREALRDRRGFVLKAGLPLVIVAGAAPAGFAGPALAMLILFTGIIGGGMAVTRLRAAGMFDRLVASPAPKPVLFIEIAATETLLHLAGFGPAILLACIVSGASLVIPALLSIAVTGVIGVLVGLASRGFGDLHLNAILAVLPLLLAAVIQSPVSLLLPFRALLVPEVNPAVPVLPLVTLSALYGLLVLAARRF
jgi:hypothetical protein